MNILQNIERFQNHIRSHFASDYTLAGLKLMIIAWSVAIIIITLLVDSKAILAAILAYEVLP